MTKDRHPSDSLSDGALAFEGVVTAARTSTLAEEWLVGGGEMAKTIKGMNWSNTPLGPMASWPQSLRTTVSLVQASNSPISLVWGPHHVQIYNDGYWPICGAKHPTAMGQDFRECWASAFPVIGDAYASALKEQPDTARIPIMVVTSRQITAADHDKLTGSVAAILEKSGFDAERFTAEVRRAMTGRPVAA